MDYQQVLKQLAAKVSGPVYIGEDGADYCTDFGATVERTPQIVVHVNGEDDIRHAMTIATNAGKTLTVRGAGHSCNAQSITDDILLINDAGEDKPEIVVLDGNCVQVSTRYPWYALEKALNALGLMVPVLTDNLGTTIGGTLSVGGFGIRSPFYGAQVDLIERLRLILPTGDAVWCSPDENPELFSFSLAGLSMLGVIETVVMKVIPWEEPIVYRRCDYAEIDDVDEAIEDMLLLLDDDRTRYVRLPGFPTNRGPIPDVPLWLEYGQLDTEENRQKANPVLPESPNRSFDGPQVMSNFTFAAHEQDKQYVDSFAAFSKCWCDFFFPREDYAKFLPHFKKLLGEEHLHIVYFMAPKRPADSPHIPLHPVKETGRQYVSIGADFIIPKQDRASIEKARGLMNGLMEDALKLGGRPYLYGSIDLTDDHKAQIFGEDYNRLLQLKAKHDPETVLVNSPLLPDVLQKEAPPKVDAPAKQTAKERT